ncbi:18580_t:CDS:1, partial [Funneliformis geosporum]
MISFNASLISYTPSSTLAKLTAVLAAIFVAPNNARVTICTDSQNVILTFQKYIHTTTRTTSINPLLKIQHFPI